MRRAVPVSFKRQLTGSSQLGFVDGFKLFWSNTTLATIGYPLSCGNFGSFPDGGTKLNRRIEPTSLGLNGVLKWMVGYFTLVMAYFLNVCLNDSEHLKHNVFQV
ncbi:unnamed protein product [Larinioides sclopetarius]|uniref:Uncharacterized protein n=1 Tax=Larinioides sclopetarius TaxID=280406 RepID=A0AAV2BG68_9ARAC